MTLLVAVAPDDAGRAGLSLAALLARSAGETLVLCTVAPSPWPPGLARVDAEYQDYLDRAAQQALDAARAVLPPDLPAEVVLSRARSAPAGLLEVAQEHAATLVVIGSSSAGAVGRVAFGSVADRLLHSSPLPVALAPRGFRARPGAVVTRVTAAFGGADSEDDLVVAAAGVAARVGASLRIASFAVRPRTIITAGIGTRAEAAVVQEWSSAVEAAQRDALESVARLPMSPPDRSAVVGSGHDWDEALEDVEWSDGDVLVVGSSAVGPVARVFLGSRASKIVRHSPVPVVVVPRGALPHLIDRAEQAPHPRS